MNEYPSNTVEQGSNEKLIELVELVEESLGFLERIVAEQKEVFSLEVTDEKFRTLQHDIRVYVGNVLGYFSIFDESVVPESELVTSASAQILDAQSKDFTFEEVRQFVKNYKPIYAQIKTNLKNSQ